MKKRPARKSVSGVEKTPPELVTAIKRSLDEMPIKGIAAATSDNYGAEPVIHQVPWANEVAERLWISVEERQFDLLDNHDGQVGIIGRTAEQTVKYATIRALSRDTANPTVTEADIHWGYAIVHRSIECIETGVAQYMAGSPFEELCNTVLRALKESKDGELAHSVILKKKGVSAYDQRMVKSAYDRLQELGEISPPRSISGGLRITLKDRTK